MAWDIYGYPLKPGHCEVHPHIGQVYPCYLCLEKERRAKQEQESEYQYWEDQARRHDAQQFAEACAPWFDPNHPMNQTDQP